MIFQVLYEDYQKDRKDLTNIESNSST